MSDTTTERQLWSALLELQHGAEVEPFLANVIALVREATDARVAYLAIGHGHDTRRPQWWTAHQLDDVELLQQRISTSLLRQASATGIVHTVDAMSDPRFRDEASVQRHRIDAVLCAPLHAGTVSIGVLYLQGHSAGGPFDDATVDLVRQAARHLGPLAQRLLWATRGDGPDPTRPWRQRLAATPLVGSSAAMARVLEALVVAASAPVPVLLTGPTGTGKTTVARVLHDSSAPTGSFVELNGAQLQPDRLVADLFGARAGAYTGLKGDQPGLVEAARGGTLFLDEVTELAPQAQAQLLTFLQSGAYRRLGETRTRHATDVRVIAATNVDPDQQVAAGHFRGDLLYRLSTLRIALPSLADRGDDVLLLAHAMVDRAARRFGIPSLPLSTAATTWLETQPWPGNIRELEQSVQRGLLWAHSAHAGSIRPDHLAQAEPGRAPARTDDLREAVRTFKRAHVRRVLEACGLNKTEAAKRLGVHRSHLYGLLGEGGVDS